MRRRFYVDPELQFPIIMALILFVTVEGAVVGWGFSKAMEVAWDWKRPALVWDFFRIVLWTVLPMVVANFVFGSYLSNKIAGPLLRMRQAMHAVSRGELEEDLVPRRRDLLQGHASDFNQMLQSLRHVSRRDLACAREAEALLAQLREKIASLDGAARQREELERLVNEAKAKLSLIGSHFAKELKA